MAAVQVVVGGGTDDTSNGSTVKLDGHVGKYYTLYYGYFSDKTLKSCIYFETSKTGTLWWTPTDGSTNFLKKVLLTLPLWMSTAQKGWILLGKE